MSTPGAPPEADRPRRQGPPSRRPSQSQRAQTERQRRLRRRALPLAAVAVAAFVIGVINGAGSAQEELAERFVQAWADQDFAAMHGELTAEAQQQFPLDQFTAAYREAQTASTATAIDPGDASESDGGVAIDVGVDTEIFGALEGTLNLPVSDERVAWQPHLTFPGLQQGERIGRRLALGDRAPILAADGTPLAEGQGAARGSPRLGSAAIDVTGTVEEPNQELAPEVAKRGYPVDQPTGVSGLELAFNPRLAGRPGGELLAVPEGTALPDVPDSVRGRVLATSEAQPGQPLETTINPRLQDAAVAALGGRSGGVAVLDARTGEVRALAGQAYSSQQPPGSTMKVVTTVAGLEEGIVKLDEQFPVVTEINPSPETGANVIENAHDEPCGGDFTTAFAKSCNTVFAPLGVDVGGEKLVETAERFGFNKEPTLYNSEATEATDPQPMEMPKEFDETGTELAASAIGQHTVLATTLGMASVAQTIAGGGTRQPTPIVTDPALRADAEPVEVTSRENARVMNGLMQEVVNSGTGQSASLGNIQVAGKTGTAELGPKPNQPPPEPVGPGEEPPDPEQIVDAWFIAFAPARKPRLAIAVMLVDADGDGGEVAAPVAQDVLAAGL